MLCADGKLLQLFLSFYNKEVRFPTILMFGKNQWIYSFIIDIKKGMRIIEYYIGNKVTLKLIITDVSKNFKILN